MTTATTSISVAREPLLLGQTVVVIGGSAGIGLETARLARSEGADVVLTGRDPERLEQAARDLSARSSAAFDADDAAAVKRFFDELPAPIDHVLVAAYTRGSHGPMLDSSPFPCRATSHNPTKSIVNPPLPLIGWPSRASRSGSTRGCRLHHRADDLRRRQA